MTTLADYCEVTMGQAPEGATYNTTGTGLPLIAGASDLGQIFPAPSRWTSVPTQSCREGDIVLCIRATIGDRNWADRTYCLGRGVAGLRAKPGRLEPRYLWHWLAAATPRLMHAARGATFLQVNRHDIESLPCSPPTSLAEQRRIADILDKADAIRHKRKETIALTEDLLRPAFLEMFGDPVTNPKGWPDVVVEDLCSNIVDCPHTTPKYTSELRTYPCVRTSDLQGGFFDWSTTKYVSAEEYRERIARLTPVARDVFYTREGERYGIAATLPEGVPACLGQRMMLLRADRTIATPEFLWALMNSSAVYRQAMAEVGGSTSPHVNVKSVRRFRVVRPPLNIQREYSRVYDSAMRSRSALHAALVEAELLFASLLQTAFGRSPTVTEVSC